MADKPPPAVVDEKFWLARAARIVEEASEKLDKGAERVAAAMAWFWTAYSSVVVAALALSAANTTWMRALLLAVPGIVLFAAYALATWASLPVPVHFNVVAPFDIKSAHEAAIETKRGRLRLSLVFAACATVLVSVVVVLTAVSKPTPVGGVAIGLSGAPVEAVVVGGTLPVDSPILVRVLPAGGTAVNGIVNARKDRPFQLTVPVPATASYAIDVSWDAGAGRRTSLREVKTP